MNVIENGILSEENYGALLKITLKPGAHVDHLNGNTLSGTLIDCIYDRAALANNTKAVEILSLKTHEGLKQIRFRDVLSVDLY